MIFISTCDKDKFITDYNNTRVFCKMSTILINSEIIRSGYKSQRNNN